MLVYLDTERLSLRQFTEADLDNLVDLDRDPEVMRFVSGGVPTPRDDIQNGTLPAFLRYCEPDESYGIYPGSQGTLR